MKVIVGITHVRVVDYCDSVIAEEFKNKIPTSEIKRLQKENAQRYTDAKTRKVKATVNTLERSVHYYRSLNY